MKSRLPLIVLLFFVCASLLHLGYYAGQLPDTVASHFGINGAADNWMSKQSFIIFYGTVLVSTAALFLFVGLFAHVVPDNLLNLPNKQYWLAPERRNETYAYIRK